jgi:putative chitinase
MLRPFINFAMQVYGINHTKERAAMFLAQLGHESDEFKTFEEYASGAAYEGRADLGNTVKGDGVRYKGRGAIQITGRFNYKQAGEALGLPLLQKPELLLQPKEAMLVSAWYWNSRKLNDIAGDLNAVTRRINGGTNGLAHRKLLWERALAVL